VDDGDRRETEGGDSAETGPESFLLFVLFEAGLAPLAVALGWMLGRPALTGFAWQGRAALLGALAAVPMIVFLLVTLRWPIGPFREIRRFLDRNLLPALEGRRWSDLALIALAAGVGEEMLFRGVIQGSLGDALGRWPGLVAASAAFGILHPVTRAYAVIAALLGAYLGLVWLVTGNLLAPMVAHAVYDFVALIVLLRRWGDGSTSTQAPE
jgi:membrane protease YdiL (CAAX protease family)